MMLVKTQKIEPQFVRLFNFDSTLDIRMLMSINEEQILQHRSAEEERSTVNAELQERLSKIDKLKKRYEILMVAMKPPEGEEEQSQVIRRKNVPRIKRWGVAEVVKNTAGERGGGQGGGGKNLGRKERKETSFINQ